MVITNENKSNVDKQLSFDVSQVFVKTIKQGNELLESGKIHEAAILFLMIEVEMQDFINKQSALLKKFSN